MSLLYQELIDFIAAGATAADVATYQPSQAARARALELLGKEKDGVISPEELAELEQFSQLEHLMRMAKAKARANTAPGGAA